MKRIILSLTVLFLLIGCGKDSMKFNKNKVISHDEIMESIDSPKDDDKGKSVIIGAKVFTAIGQEQDRNYYAVFADPDNYEKSFMLDVPKEVKFNDNDYIPIEGIISGQYKGTNLMGGINNFLSISSENTIKSTYFEAIVPALETIEVNETKTQNDVDIIIEKVEGSAIDTRLYVEIKNNTNDKLSVYTNDFKIVANGKGSLFFASKTLPVIVDVSWAKRFIEINCNTNNKPKE